MKKLLIILLLSSTTTFAQNNYNLIPIPTMKNNTFHKVAEPIQYQQYQKVNQQSEDIKNQQLFNEKLIKLYQQPKTWVEKDIYGNTKSYTEIYNSGLIIKKNNQGETIRTYEEIMNKPIKTY